MQSHVSRGKPVCCWISMPALLDVKCLAANAAGRQRQTTFQGCQAASEISSKGVLAMGLVFANVSCILATCVCDRICVHGMARGPTKVVILENVLGFKQILAKVVALLKVNLPGYHDCKKLCICSRSASTTWKLICNLRYHISCNVICPFLGPIILGFWILVHLSLFYIMPKVVLWKSIVQAPNLYYHGAGLCAPPFGQRLWHIYLGETQIYDGSLHHQMETRFNLLRISKNPCWSNHFFPMGTHRDLRTDLLLPYHHFAVAADRRLRELQRRVNSDKHLDLMPWCI